MVPGASKLTSYGKKPLIDAIVDDYYLEHLDLDEAQALIGFKYDPEDY